MAKDKNAINCGNISHNNSQIPYTDYGCVLELPFLVLVFWTIFSLERAFPWWLLDENKSENSSDNFLSLRKTSQVDVEQVADLKQAAKKHFCFIQPN